MKNKKLIKRIAVASLACFLVIPTINTVPTQAKTVATVEYYTEKIAKAEKVIENLKTDTGYTEEERKQLIASWNESISGFKDCISKIQSGQTIYVYENQKEHEQDIKQQKEEKAQRQVEQAAQKAAEQSEKDRIANTIYKIEVDNVLDFIPHFEPGESINFAKTYKYERADMPGVIFTLSCYKDAGGHYNIADIDPHFTIENVRNYTLKRYSNGNCQGDIEYDSIQDFTFNYLSPFDGVIPLTIAGFQADVGDDYRLKTYTGGHASTQIGWNSYKVHSFYKMLKEDGTVIFDNTQSYNLTKNAKEVSNLMKGKATIVFTSNPLYKEELIKSKANAQSWVENWDEQGLNPIIEVIQN